MFAARSDGAQRALRARQPAQPLAAQPAAVPRDIRTGRQPAHPRWHEPAPLPGPKAAPDCARSQQQPRGLRLVRSKRFLRCWGETISPCQVSLRLTAVWTCAQPAQPDGTIVCGWVHRTVFRGRGKGRSGRNARLPVTCVQVNVRRHCGARIVRAGSFGTFCKGLRSLFALRG